MVAFIEANDDDDSRFLFLWISFNAAYASEASKFKLNEREVFNHFISRLVKFDSDKLLFNILWNELPSSIRVLMNNQFIFQPSWNYHNSFTNDQSKQTWEEAFEKENKSMLRAISKQDTKTALSIIISRLYTLRNQIMHGGATWKSGANREQVRDCTAILSKVVPAVIQIMMNSTDKWVGDVCYPVVK